MKLTKQKISLLFGLSLASYMTYSQVPTGSPPSPLTVPNMANAAWYRGGNTNANGSNNIFGTAAGFNSPIYTITDGLQRTILNGTRVATLNGVPFHNTSGYMGISPTGYFGIPNNTPWAMLHLDGPNNTGFNGDWRSWMKTGVYMRENSDAMYVGLKQESGLNRSDAVINWSDDPVGSGGVDKLRFLFTSTAPTGSGSGTDPRNGASFNGYEFMRMQSFPAVNNGAGFPIGHVGIGPMFTNALPPQNRLHMNAEDNLANFLQISNTTGTGQGALDGLHIGYPTTTPTFLTAQINQKENDNLLLLTNQGERIRVSHIGNVSVANMNPGGIPNDRTRVSISHDPLNPVTRPLSLLHLGYNTGALSFPAGSTDGWRNWMDIGMFTSNGTDNVYIGLKNEGTVDRNDAVISWGDNQINSGIPVTNGPDNFRFIFTSTNGLTGGGTPPATGPNGLEGLRMTPTTANGIYTGVGGAIGNLYSGGVPNPNNTLEVNSWGATTAFGGSSGLRFTNLTVASPTIANPGTGVLSVDANGDVIYVPGGSGTSLGNVCGATTTQPLLNDWEIPLNLNNFYFSGNNATKERVAVGLACGTVLPSKFNVALDKTFSTSFAVGNNAGYFRNINVGAAHNVGVKGEVTAGPGDNTGGYFISNSTAANAGNVGTRSIASSGTSAFGVLATSQNGSIWSVAGKFDVMNSNSPQNYGINSNVFGSTNPSSTNFGGLFYNSYTGSTNFGVQATAFNSTANYAIFGAVGGTNTSTTPNWAGYFNGDVFTSSIQYYASDKDLKKDIQVIKAPLEKVMKLKPSYFQYDTDKGNLYGMNLPEGYNYGFIAQEIETVFPELVINTISAPVVDSSGITSTPQTPFKAVNYNGMIGIVTGAVQELNTKQQAMQASLDKAGLSDAQVKTNVNTFNALATVKTLSPVKYNFTNANVPQLNFKPNTDYGFIAQQLETVYPELVDTIRIDATYDSLGVVVNPSKVLKTVNYKAMSALLVRSIQEQQLTIDSLRNVYSKQDSINQSVQQQLAALASQINSCCSNTSSRNANSNINQLDVELSDKDAIVLNQNVPNPFAEQTTITYNVPTSVEKAQLIFFNANGQVIQTVDIKTRGKGKVNVFAADLSSGLYHYTLVADGKVADSKKMVRE